MLLAYGVHAKKGRKRMKLKNFSLKKLHRLLATKSLIIFGAGRNFNRFCSDFKDWDLEKKIEYIVDNSSQKWGEKVSLNGRTYEIQNPVIMEKLPLEKYIILITPKEYEPIYYQLQGRYSTIDVVCCTIPQNIYYIEMLFEAIMKRLPLKNMLVLSGEGDTCENACALGEYIKEKGYIDNYKLIWLCNNPNRISNANEKSIGRMTLENSTSLKERLKYHYYMCTSKYVIFENAMIEKKRPEQVSVYLKHGEIPLKSVKGIIVMPKDLNFTIAASELSREITAEQFTINKERVFFCGMPRTDILFSKSVDEQVIKSLEVQKYKKTILWMPTFRKHSNGLRNDSNKEFDKGIPIVYSDRELDQLVDFLMKKDIQVILKLHKYQDVSQITVKKSDNLKVITQDQVDGWNIDTHRMMRYTDALITDYSSVAFDYMLLNRPIGYTIDDIDEYKLGFAHENIYEFMPGEKIVDFQQLLGFIDKVSKGQDDYSFERNRIKEQVNELSIGHSCSDICKYLGIEK